MKKIKPVHIVAIILVIAIAGNAYWFLAYQRAVNANPNVQTDRIVANLSKTTTLPSEQPSVVTVLDKSKLSNSTIAQSVENGDKILLYQQARKVVIYRPSTGKLVTIYNLSADTATQSTTKTTPTPSPATR